MADTPYELRRVVWTEIFPFLRLFRAFQLAIRPSRIGLSLLAIMWCYIVGRGLDAAWPADTHAGGITTTPFAAWLSGGPPLFDLDVLHDRYAVIRPTGPFSGLGGLGSNAWLIQGVHTIAMVAAHPGYAALYLLLTIPVLGLVASAIARQAALQSFIDEQIPMRAAWKYAWGKRWDIWRAPLLLAALAAAGLAVLLLFGLLGAIPVLGELLISLSLPFTLLIGFVLALLLIATVLGFSLIWPGLMIEGSDQFDAISRAFSFVGRRPWHYLFYLVLFVAYAAICVGFVRLLIAMTLQATHFGLMLGMKLVGAQVEGADLFKLERIWSAPGGAELAGSFLAAPHTGVESFAGWIIAAIVYLVVSLVPALALSLWVCGHVQIYSLLRKTAEHMDYDEIYYEDRGVEPHDDAQGGVALPVVGQS